MKKIIMFILVLLVLILVWFKIVPLWTNTPLTMPIPIFNELNSNESIISQNGVDLNTMLNKGIKTQIGIIKSIATSSGNSIMINNKTVSEIQAQSPIELSNLFAIEGSQIFLIGYNQGGNDCNIKYQFITINKSGYKLSSQFGNCLPYTKAQQTVDTISINFKSNNEYATQNDFIVYQYQNGLVKQTKKDKSDKYYLKKYASLSAKGIMALAIKDGCANDGILNYDNACSWGKKYCTMFKALKNPVKDNDYQTLKEFCD